MGKCVHHWNNSSPKKQSSLCRIIFFAEHLRNHFLLKRSDKYVYDFFALYTFLICHTLWSTYCIADFAPFFRGKWDVSGLDAAILLVKHISIIKQTCFVWYFWLLVIMIMWTMITWYLPYYRSLPSSLKCTLAKSIKHPFDWANNATRFLRRKIVYETFLFCCQRRITNVTLFSLTCSAQPFTHSVTQ